MVRYHVAQRACLLVVAAAASDANLLGHGDLHVVYIASIPDRLEDGVGEAEDQYVLNGLLAQVVIDTVDLRFVQDFLQLMVQGSGRVEIPAQRLLDDNPPPATVLLA